MLRGLHSTTRPPLLWLALTCTLFSFLISCGDNGGTTGSGRVTYTVSGVISNLTADGLVLQLNGGNSLQVGAASSLFEFPVGLSDGQPYSITVKQSPASETCTIQHGASGTIAGADVVGVPIICTARQFTVGGAISNLAGQGLVIQDQASSALANPSTGAVSYTLSPFVTGQNYNIIIGQQPTNPTQVCSVGNPSGQVASSNIQNATVTCTTQSYAVGGTVAGLLGSGLQLKDAVSGQTVTVQQGSSGSVAFNFPAPVLSGANYQVSVAIQPSGLNQTCTVAGGSGSVGSAPVTNIAVTCVTNLYGISGTIGGPAANSTTGLLLKETVTGTQAVITGNSFTFPFPNGGIPDGSSFHISIQELESAQTNATSHCSLDSTGADGTIAGGNFTLVSVTCRFISSGLSGIGESNSTTTPGTVAFFQFDAVSGSVSLAATAATSDSSPSSLVSVSLGFSSDPADYYYYAPLYVANRINGTITPFAAACSFNASLEYPGEACYVVPLSCQFGVLPTCGPNVDVSVPTGAAKLALDPSAKNLYSTSGVSNQNNDTVISSFVFDSSGNLTNRADTTFTGFQGIQDLLNLPPVPKILFDSADDHVLFLPLDGGSDQQGYGVISGFDVSLFQRASGNGALTQENIAAALAAGGLPSDGSAAVPVDAVATGKNLYVVAETLQTPGGGGADHPPVPAAAPSVVGYAFTPSGLSLTAGSPYQIPNTPPDSESAVVIDPSDTYLFLVDSSSISAFHINSDGSLTLAPGSPIATVGVVGLADPIIDPSGRFLYAAAESTSDIVAYRINLQPTAASPVLSLIGIYPTAGSGQLLMDNSGKFLFDLIPPSASEQALGTSPLTSEISGYFIDPNSGALSLTAGSPYTFNYAVYQLVALPPYPP